MVIDLGQIDQSDLDDAEEAFFDFLEQFDDAGGNNAALFFHMHAFIAEMAKELAERPN
jgi:hypothetical protein